MKIYRDWCDVPIVLTTEIAADITGEYVKNRITSLPGGKNQSRQEREKMVYS